jgi:NADP-dependent 3-hydroxy acid dehydrogenase YdfG
VLTGAVDVENRQRGKTRATVTETLAVINTLKERRRGRFVTAGGSEALWDAYRGRVHEAEKMNAIEAVDMMNNALLQAPVRRT